MEKIEVWKTIKYYPDYMVSSKGRVMSLPREVNFGFQGRRVTGGRILGDKPSKNGYPKVTLRQDNKSTQKYVHYLVATHFVGERPKGMAINHIDGNKLNNCRKNLEICTYSRNIKHAYDTGLKEKRFVANQWVGRDGKPTSRDRRLSKIGNNGKFKKYRKP